MNQLNRLFHLAGVLAAALLLLGVLIVSLVKVQMVWAAPAATQQFAINIGDTVSDGIPAPGAGNLEAPGDIDVYTFNATAGQELIFDWLTGANTQLGWQLLAPDGTVLFDSVFRDWQVVLSQTGVYTLTVDGNSASSFGVYSFRLLELPAPQQFGISIGDTISDGIPASGAGNLEAPGALDIYTFSAAGQEVIFDWLSGANTQLGWQLQAPDGTVLFDSVFQDWQVVLSQTGVYTLTIDGNAIDSFGLYSFRLLEVPAPQQFGISIGDTVSDGVPAPGAGNLEAPGALDIYTFSAAGQEVIFDWLSGANTQLGWQLQAPDGTTLFDSVFQDWQIVLAQTGVYTLTVDGNAIDSFGSYSFQLLEVPLTPQQFHISYGDTISDGVPAAGAGNLEVPGAVDMYTFDALSGQNAIFDWLSGNNVQLGWHLQAPDNTTLFDTVLEDRQLVLPQTGVYTLTVDGNALDSVGVYGFQLLEVTAVPQQFTISFGDIISDGIPAVGAGNLEAPGAVDIYTFDAVAGQKAHFDWLAGNNTSLSWQLHAPDNSLLFDTPLQDQQVALFQTGTYTVTVKGLGIDDFGSYSFALLETYAIYLPLVQR